MCLLQIFGAYLDLVGKAKFFGIVAITEIQSLVECLGNADQGLFEHTLAEQFVELVEGDNILSDHIITEFMVNDLLCLVFILSYSFLDEEFKDDLEWQLIGFLVV